MNIGILGTGGVAQTLGGKLIALGHQVKLGSRTAGNDKAAAWAAANGAAASHGTFAGAAQFGELLILATLGTGTLEAVQQAGADNLAGKTLIDLTNPLDFSQGMPPHNFTGPGESLSEQVQAAAPAARVVKALNIVNAEQMVDPASVGGDPDMFVAGDDEAAKNQVVELLRQFGWKNILDLGGLRLARALEGFTPLWVAYSLKTGTWQHAAKFLRK